MVPEMALPCLEFIQPLLEAVVPGAVLDCAQNTLDLRFTAES
jgi:hypothetical protein